MNDIRLLHPASIGQAVVWSRAGSEGARNGGIASYNCKNCAHCSRLSPTSNVLAPKLIHVCFCHAGCLSRNTTICHCRLYAQQTILFFSFHDLYPTVGMPIFTEFHRNPYFVFPSSSCTKCTIAEGKHTWEHALPKLRHCGGSPTSGTLRWNPRKITFSPKPLVTPKSTQRFTPIYLIAGPWQNQLRHDTRTVSGCGSRQGGTVLAKTDPFPPETPIFHPRMG